LISSCLTIGSGGSAGPEAPVVIGGAAIASILFSRMINYVHERAHKVTLPAWVRAAIGGCVVGFIGFFLPVVLGEGYPSVRAAIEGAFTPGLAVVGLATLGKIVATALTLGSGGSGGIFAPCLVVGSFAGLISPGAGVPLAPRGMDE